MKDEEHQKERIIKLPKSAWGDYEVIYEKSMLRIIVSIQGTKQEAKQELKNLKKVIINLKNK